MGPHSARQFEVSHDQKQPGWFPQPVSSLLQRLCASEASAKEDVSE
jgi:hypothetical protein